jgi:hypothetical protein
MKSERKNGPVILMMERNAAPGRVSVREWLEQSRFMTSEAHNIFDALDGLSDFTVRERPDVIVLDVESCTADLPLIREMMGSVSPGFDRVIALSNEVNTKESGGCFAKDLTQVADRLEDLVSGGVSGLR